MAKTAISVKLDDKMLAIAEQLKDKNFYEIEGDKPRSLHKSLYDAARRRGFVWNFAITDRSVIVYK